MPDDAFLSSPSGGIDFGYLPEDAAKRIRRQAGPIRLLESDLQHIEERHGDQIRHAGYEDVPSFIQSVCTEFNTIYRGKHGGGALVLIVRVPERPNKTAIIKLQPDTDPGKGGTDFYAVKTAMLTEERYYKKEIPLLQRDAPITISLEGTPFRARPEADGTRLVDEQTAVKGKTDGVSVVKGRTPAHEENAQEKDIMATQAAMEESREVLETADSAGSMGPAEKSRAVPKVIKKKLTLPITGEVDLPEAVREAMNYRVEVVPLVLDEGSVLARSELKPGEQPIAYEVLRRGNDLEGLNPLFSVAVDRMRFDARQDPQAAEKAIQKAQELAALKLDRNLLIPGYGKATPENQEKLLHSAFRDALDDRKTPAKAPEQSQESDPAKPEPERPLEPEKEVSATKQPGPKSPEPDNAELVRNWPKAQGTPPAKARPAFERHAPEPLLTHKNRPLVLDYGDHITVTRRAMMGIGTSARQKRELAVSTALQAAVQRFGEPVHFEGNPRFLRETAAMAVKLGIPLEPGSKLAEQVYREAREQAARERGNTLGPARKAPEPQKILQQDPGLER